CRQRPTTSGAGHRQEQHGHMGELPAHLPLIRAEFTNHALIEILQFRHLSSRGRGCLPSTASYRPGHGVNVSEGRYPHGDEATPMEGWCGKCGRAMSQTVSLTAVGPYG